MASMRRTPAAMPLSDRILNRPMSPARPTCVPPHSSVRKPELEHADAIAVLVAEERERAGRDGVVVRHDPNVGVVVERGSVVHERLDLPELLGADGLVVRKIEPQPIRRHERALLLNVLAEHRAQRRVQQMRGRVIEHRRLAALGVDGRMQPVADREPPGLERADVAVRRAELLRVAHGEAHAGRRP